MAEPSEKSPETETFLERVTGRDRRSSIEADTCTICGQEATRFRDKLSIKEYRISGMCQSCQDKVFT